jgi:uncharacterized SAM-binding protein YcdF (DUF218 family)
MRYLRSCFRRRFRVILLSTLAAGIFLPLLIRWSLTVDSGPVHADAIVVLGGDGDKGAYRPRRAADLFREGVAPKILVSGNGDCDLNASLLETLGVPAAAITREDRSKNTFQNAQFATPSLRQMDVHRVIIVTSWYHSRRALACFEQAAPGITFYSRPCYFGVVPWQWNFNLVRAVAVEGVKLAGYWLRYGVRPFV